MRADVIANIHSGWRGAVQKIAAEAIDAIGGVSMHDAGVARPVDPRLLLRSRRGSRRAVPRAYAEADRSSIAAARSRTSILPRLTAALLRERGIAPQNIHRLRPLHALRRLDLPLLSPRPQAEVDGTLQSWRALARPLSTHVVPRRRTVFQVISISVVVVLVADRASSALYVYKQSVGKFEIRRLSLPTRIFADYTPLRRGVVLGPDDLARKTQSPRLPPGHRARRRPATTFPAGRRRSIVYTRPFTHPTGEYPSQPVRVAFKNGSIDSVVSLRRQRRRSTTPRSSRSC